MRTLARADLGRIKLAYEVRGTGEPVVLLHAGVFADWFAPLLEQSALTEQYRLVSYHRVNYGNSTHLDGAVSVADQAAHCRVLLEQLGIERAHLVGHSAGASIALQLALDAPAVVRSLALLEPAISALPGAPATSPAFIGEAIARYGAGDRVAAVDQFMRGVCGSNYRARIEAALPAGAFEQAVADADHFFRQELPALEAWRFGAEEAARIEMPVLIVAGAESSPIFAQRQRLLREWLPRGEAFTLARAGHLLYVQQPGAMAAALAEFVGRHPIEVACPGS
jgi:pimeloyl-ACP methyl ester carboxylesterase